ncbi:MAG: electron transport complex subunit RsxC [Firmicutes bacterium]|nr:electron transport complex subunit RsxC [Candidatus Fermentithermobacillaceae bacterium]
MIGGVSVPDKKELSESSPIEFAGLPGELILFLSQHIGAPSVPLVKPKDTVKRGQVIAEPCGFVSVPLHAPTSGVIKAIEPRYHPGQARMCEAIILEPDGKHEPAEELSPAASDLDGISPDEIRELARQAGIVGLGGAAFPTSVKLAPPEDKPIDTYLLNGSECEPYLTADHRLMLEQADKVMFGFKGLMKAAGVRRGIVCIEDNKPDAIEAMKQALSAYDGLELAVLSTRYPRGGEKQLIQAVLGREVPPPPGLPYDVGVLVSNVGTAYALADAVLTGVPLVERVVTVTGEGVAKPSNFRTLIGTPVSYLIEKAGGFKGTPGKVILGGPMMGCSLRSLDVPVFKGASGILVLTKEQAVEEPILPCVKCGKCVDVCPMGLQPLWISAYAERELMEEAETFRAMDCIECGCCAYICPAKRPLVQWIKMAKADISSRRSAQKKS